VCISFLFFLSWASQQSYLSVFSVKYKHMRHWCIIFNHATKYELSKRIVCLIVPAPTPFFWPATFPVFPKPFGLTLMCSRGRTKKQTRSYKFVSCCEFRASKIEIEKWTKISCLMFFFNSAEIIFRSENIKSVCKFLLFVFSYGS
jgi:hypothetical protein